MTGRSNSDKARTPKPREYAREMKAQGRNAERPQDRKARLVAIIKGRRK